MELNKELKKGRFKISSGDIFEVVLSNGNRRYFQFLYKDDNYMAGHVIRAFTFLQENDENINLQNLALSSIQFITHTRVFEGLKDKLWNKIGNIPLENNFDFPIFRQTNDVSSQVKKSTNWFIWQYDPENRKYIGELTDEYCKLPVSSIFPPSAIVEWLETGWHGFKMPE